MSAREYLTLIREQGWVVLLCIVLGLGGAALLTVVIPPSYASQASYYVASASTAADVTATDNYSGAQLSAERVKSYSELIRGTRVAADASALLGGGVTPPQLQDAITTDSVTETVILNATVTGPTPQEATRRATAVTQVFTSLAAQLETSRGPGTPPSVTIQVVQPPSPGVVVAPRPALYLLVGAIIGLVVGFGIAVARRSLVRSVSRSEDLEGTVRAPVLAEVPLDRRTKDPLLGNASPAPSGSARSLRRRLTRSEAYQRARTQLEFANINRDRHILLVASAVHGEGRTTTAVNLAAALAATGRRVIVVEADLRRPSLAEALALPPSAGLTAVLLGRSHLPDALRTWNGNVHVLPAGEAPARPNDVLASSRCGTLIRELGARYDYVLVDSPPLLPVGDAATVGRHVDAAIVVCRSGRTNRDSVRAACSALRAVAIPIVGAVLSHSSAPPSLKAVRASGTTGQNGMVQLGSWTRRTGAPNGNGVEPPVATESTAGSEDFTGSATTNPLEQQEARPEPATNGAPASTASTAASP